MIEGLSLNAAKPEQDISLLYLTSDPWSARQLSGSLRASGHFIQVEWIHPGRGQLGRLVERLALLSSKPPPIVMLDFNAFGAEIWPFIARCTILVPGTAVEWLVVNHRGPCPKLHESLWRNITVLPDSWAVN